MWRSVPILLALLALAAGCAPENVSANGKINQWLMATQTEIPPGVYTVQPPDVIAVLAPKIPELNGRGGKIRSDGRVTFNLVGTLYVAGMTTDQIADELTKRLARYYGKDALDVRVRVTEYRSRAVYVFGQVNQPGSKPFTGRDSILGVLAAAQLNNDAWPEKVVVVRPNEDPNIRQKITVDLKRMFVGGDVSQDVLLEEGDVIYVPPSPLAQLTITFNKLLMPIRPVGEIAAMAGTGGF